MMRNFTLGSLLFLLICSSCGESAEKKVLDAHLQSLGSIDRIKCIVAKAACSGPDGPYSTLTESSMTQPYLFFKQEYSHRSPFLVLVESYKEGYGLDSSYDNAGAISKAMIGVVKAHEFHKLMFEIGIRYTNLKITKDTTFFGDLSTEMSALDPLKLPVKLYFDKEKKHLNGFTQVNPYKRSELIQIHFSDWYEQGGVLLFDKVEILQGTTAKYDFDYQTVVFNDPGFKRKSL